MVMLENSVHPNARAEFDHGLAPAEMRLERMMLLLKPSASLQAELDALVDAQHNPGSPEFHHWLTTAEYAARFGAGAADLARIQSWLEGHGFTVDEIPSGHRLVIFSGPAGQVAEAFHTDIHRYRVGTAEHFANAQNPQIPAGLANVVGGIVSMHDFRRAPAMAAHRALQSTPQWTLNGTHYLFPADFAAIYNLNPLYGAGTSGAGVPIAIAGRSNINLGDVEAFRASANLKDNNPAIVLAGADPGLEAGDQDEATLDVEWAGAVAPAAAVTLVAAASTLSTDGIDLSAQYIVNHALAPVVSVSYGSCEQQMGAAELAFYNSLWQQAAVQGMSVFVASGDSGAAGCNLGSDTTGSVSAVNGLCSSPYSTCVGGTEFNEGADVSRYWAETNQPNQGSALGYIPETVWNESGASSGAWLWASGGGASQVYAQPRWQQGVNGASAANGMRAVPDVSLSAASHDGYIIYENGSYWIVSGTSAAVPAMAAMMALVVQSTGGAGQGNANAAIYPLASGNAGIFHVTPVGSNTVPGVTGYSAGPQTYNLATGLGSVDATLLVNGWNSAATPPPTLSLAAPARVVLQFGAPTSIRLAAATGGSFEGNLTFSVTGLPSGITAVFDKKPIAPHAGTGAVMLTLRASPFRKAVSGTVAVTVQGSGLTATRQIAVVAQQIQHPVRIGATPVILLRTQ